MDGIPAVFVSRHHIPEVVDNVVVVAAAAGERVGTGSAVEGVIAVEADERVHAGATEKRVGTQATGDHIREGVSGQIDPSAIEGISEVCEIFQSRSQSDIANRRCDGVDINGPSRLVDYVVLGIHQIIIVSFPSDQCVLSALASQRVITVSAGEKVCKRVSEKNI